MKLYPVWSVPVERADLIRLRSIFGVWLVVSMLNPMTVLLLGSALVNLSFSWAVFAILVTLLLTLPALILALMGRLSGYIGWAPALAAGLVCALLAGIVLHIVTLWLLGFIFWGVCSGAMFWLLIRKSNPDAFTPH